MKHNMAMLHRPSLMQVLVGIVAGVLTRSLLHESKHAVVFTFSPVISALSSTPSFRQVVPLTLRKPAASAIAWDEPNYRHKPCKNHEHPAAIVDAFWKSKSRALRDFEGYVGPRYMDYFTFEETTPVWRAKKSTFAPGITKLMDIPYSLIVPPNPTALAKRNTGYIMVAVTSCCKSWGITGPLLKALLDMDDPIHVVLIDDHSVDGTPEKAAAMGVPVLTTGRLTGVTASMNRAWQYFSSYDSLQALVMTNNDVLFAPGSFTKLHRCIMAMPSPPGVVGPVSDSHGLGFGSKMQNIDSVYARSRFYKNQKPPMQVRQNLPASLPEMSKWLDGATAHAAESSRMYYISTTVLYGFVLGFRKDHGITDYSDNILMEGNLNTEQEYMLFQRWQNKGYICSDVFGYHIKAATFQNETRAHFKSA